MTVDILSYLPPLIARMPEYQNISISDDAELEKLWEELDRKIANDYFETADEDGIARFEKLLGITPSASDSLEVRRLRVKTQWLNMIPYTMNTLRRKLDELVGKQGYALHEDQLKQYIFGLDIYDKDDALCDLIVEILNEWLPANLVTAYRSIATKRRVKNVYAGAAGAQLVRYTLKPMTSNKTMKAKTLLPIGSSIFVYTRMTVKKRGGE